MLRTSVEASIWIVRDGFDHSRRSWLLEMETATARVSWPIGPLPEDGWSEKVCLVFRIRACITLGFRSGRRRFVFGFTCCIPICLLNRGYEGKYGEIWELWWLDSIVVSGLSRKATMPAAAMFVAQPRCSSPRDYGSLCRIACKLRGTQ